MIVVVAIAALAKGLGESTTDDLTLKGTGSTQAQDLLDEKLAAQANGTNPVVLEATKGKLTGGTNERAVKATVKSLRQAPHVISAVSPFSGAGADALSKDKRIAYISVALDVSRADLDEDEANDVIEAAARAVATAGGAVVFAGGTVVIALVAMGVAQIPLVTALGASAATVVAIAVLAAITLLPALLSILGRRIDSLRVPFIHPRPHDDRPHGWSRWARGVGRHPWPAIIAAVALLLVLAIPILNLRLGQQDNGQLSKSTTVRQAYDLLTRGFGPGVNGPFLIAVDFDGTPAHPDHKKLNQLKQQQQQQQQQAVEQATSQLEAEGVPPDEAQTEAEQQVASQPPSKKQKQASQEESFLKTTASDPRLVKLENKIGKTKGVKDVSPATVDKSDSAAVFTVIPTTAPSANATEDLVRTLRSTVIPDA